MKITTFLVCFLVGIVLLFQFTSCSRLRKMKEKIKSLEAKLDLETQYRHKDYKNIMSKIKEMTSKLNQLEAAMDWSDIVYDDSDNSTESLIDENNDELDEVSSDDLKLSASIIRAIQYESNLNKMLQKHVQKVDKDLRKTRKGIMRGRNRTNESFKVLNERFVTSIIAIKKDMSRNNIAIQDSIKESSRKIMKNVSNMIETFGKSVCNKCKSGLTHLDSKPNASNTNDQKKADTGDTSVRYMTSCKDWYDNGYKISGVYSVNITDNITNVNVYCDQDTDGGGWTVFQRRQNGNVDFYKNWEAYKTGFGDIHDEFWLGNEYLYYMLLDGNHELRIDMRDFNGKESYAKYDSFSIGDEESDYVLNIDGYKGTSGNSLLFNMDMPFVTFDHSYTKKVFSKQCPGGWWKSAANSLAKGLSTCGTSSNLNGLYYQDETRDRNGIIWGTWKGSLTLKSSEMKFR